MPTIIISLLAVLIAAVPARADESLYCQVVRKSVAAAGGEAAAEARARSMGIDEGRIETARACLLKPKKARHGVTHRKPA